SGTLAVAPIVLDITDAMRERLYGGDIGETAMFYGQYCERIKDKAGRIGFSGIHEGIDFVNEPGAALHAILGGEVTRAGDSNGTVGIYSAEYDITLLYLHCEKISVRRGDVVEAGDKIAVEGDKNSGSSYTHVEMRYGRHTSSSPYRDTVLTSDCPYAVLQTALGVVESGRQPVTAAAVLQAQRMREEAEAAARAAAEAEAAAEAAAKAAAEAQQNEEPEIQLLDELPAAQQGYGFAEATAEPENTPAPEEGPVVDATLPPANP
ncbi:MAG: M23 family metallopeptidase, partial [Clostridia bacterium]|nr:M23 family metallopeptidase [Clostridia bacterium]